MSIAVGDYSFKGPYKFLNLIEDLPGIFAVHYYRDGNYYLLDVDQAEALRSEMKRHSRQDDWVRFSRGTLTFAVYYTGANSKPERRRIVNTLRRDFEPVCGDRPIYS